ncbi:serine protease [Streptomyces sp. AcH 505]|uniref:trypsin-like peptidase domain-containing protein n=1 Tax=Streptomyces sp. AcH 505 TaxID=352211 RepID=UPI0018E384DE
MGTPRWAARIRRSDGEIVGSGILLSPDRVLTCAHVVREGEPVTAEFVGAEGVDVPSVTAHVIDGMYKPEELDADLDPIGDVALLSLDTPRPADEAVQLHRLSSPGRPVRMYGFPEAHNGGIWLPATVLGGCGRDGQVQLTPLGPGLLASPGFSGGGVVDTETGEVVGMVLSKSEARHGSGFTFMSPAETIVQHLEDVADWTTGLEAVDVRLRSGASDADEALLDTLFAERLATWFRDDGRQVKISLVPDGDSARAATLRRAITLADRELRTWASTRRASLDPPGTVPSAGGHDLAVVADGLTAAEAADLIANRLGLWKPPDAPAIDRIRAAKATLTLVVVGVDKAAEPDRLLDLLALLRTRGSRLLLVFGEAGAHFRRAQSELVIEPTQRQHDALVALLDEITGPLASALRQRMAAVHSDTAKRALSALVRAYAIQQELAGTHGFVAGLGQNHDLGVFGESAARSADRIRSAIGTHDELVARRDELRGRLAAYGDLYQAEADHEDLDMADRYLAAHQLLRARPCDVPAAEAAVLHYIRSVEEPDASPAQEGEPPR